MNEQKIGGSIKLSQHEYLDYLKVKSDLADLKAKYVKAVRCLKNFQGITPTNGPKNENYADAYETLTELGEE